MWRAWPLERPGHCCLACAFVRACLCEFVSVDVFVHACTCACVKYALWYVSVVSFVCVCNLCVCA